MSPSDRSTRREFIVITSSAALGAAVPSAGAHRTHQFRNLLWFRSLTKFLIHRNNSSTTDPSAPSAAIAPRKSRCPWEESEPVASV